MFSRYAALWKHLYILNIRSYVDECPMFGKTQVNTLFRGNNYSRQRITHKRSPNQGTKCECCYKICIRFVWTTHVENSSNEDNINNINQPHIKKTVANMHADTFPNGEMSTPKLNHSATNHRFKYCGRKKQWVTKCVRSLLPRYLFEGCNSTDHYMWFHNACLTLARS